MSRGAAAAPGAAGNAFALVATGVGARVAAFVGFVLTARLLGAEELSVIALGLSLAAIGFEAGEGGLDPVLVRALARARGDDAARLASGLAAKAIVTAPALVAGLVLVPVLVDGAEARTAAAVLFPGLWVGGLGRTLATRFQARERMVWRGALELVRNVGLLAGALVLTATGGGVRAVGALYAVVEVGQALVSVGVHRWRHGPLRAWPRARLVRALLRQSIAPAAAAVLAIAYLLLDRVLVWVFASDSADLGVYEAIERVVLALTLVPAAVAQAVFPALAGRDLGRGRRLYDAALHVLATLALPVALGGGVVATDIVRALYGAGFADASRSYAWALFVASAMVFLSYVPASGLLALGRQGALVRIAAVLAATSLVANLILVPLASAAGAAAAMVLTQGLAVVLFGRAVRAATGVAPGPRLPLGVPIAAVACALAAHVTPGVVWGRIAVGFVVYVALLAASRALPIAAWQVLRERVGSAQGSSTIASQ